MGIDVIIEDDAWDAIQGAAYYQLRLTFVADPITGAVPSAAALGLAWE